MFKRILNLFQKNSQNAYLASHGYYRSIDRKQSAKTYGKYPYLPYSLADFLKSKSVKGKNILVIKHGETARWFYTHGKNIVTLGREHRSSHGNPSRSLNYLSSAAEYEGEPLDMLIVDGNIETEIWNHLKPFMNASSVLIVVHSHYREHSRCLAMEQDLFGSKSSTKVLEFSNPAPGIDELFAELYYDEDNFLGI